METPICDFVRRYSESGALRLHMPGHKGNKNLGCEPLDITEIEGADSLYEANGIIARSEENASALFGAHTFYSTEGSSQCIRAMLYLAALSAKAKGKSPSVLAGRNAHKTFLSAAALLDLDVRWIYPESNASYLSCAPTAEQIEALIAEEKPGAVYLTSPDYLGNTADIGSIAEVCHRYGVLLLVDNAHGAYLKFLPKSLHPMDMGADICCDSAHKTLPVLGGGAYLHISHSAPAELIAGTKDALALFGSTSPSYLILQSLDAANAYLADGYREKLANFEILMRQLRQSLEQCGYVIVSDEPLKITVSAKPYGYSGRELADILAEHDIVCEFCDPDFLTLMFTPEISADKIEQLKQAFKSIPKREEIRIPAPSSGVLKSVMSIREATLSPREEISVFDSVGRVLASASVGCPPAVPIAVCGERIDIAAKEQFLYYGIKTVTVIK